MVYGAGAALRLAASFHPRATCSRALQASVGYAIFYLVASFLAGFRLAPSLRASGGLGACLVHAAWERRPAGLSYLLRCIPGCPSAAALL